MRKSVVMQFYMFFVGVLCGGYGYQFYKDWKEFPQKMNQRLRETWNDRRFRY